VRIFTIPMSDSQRDRLVGALTTLCQRPLDHPSIARPIVSGVENGKVYLVHTYLPGTSLTDLATRASLPLPEIIVRLTYLAGALDFAAAGGVLHGALGPDDVIFSEDNAGVSGLGLVQALESAGIPGFHAGREDDVAALIEIARDLVGDQVPPAVAAVLAAPPPATALAFASALHDALPMEAIGEPTLAATHAPLSADRVIPAADHVADEFDDRLDDGRVAGPSLSPVAGDLFDIPLREDAGPDAYHADRHGFDPEPAAYDPEPAAYEAPAFDPLPAPAPILRDQAVANALSIFGAEDINPVVHSRRRVPLGWLVGAAAVALAIFAGFAGGFFVGKDTPATPVAVTAPAATPPPEATNGRDYTDAAVDEPKTQGAITSTPLSPLPADAPPSAPASAPAAQPPASTRNQPAPPRAAAPPTAAIPAARPPRPQPATPTPSGPAAVRVDSLPAGAQVFVDGRSVGYTPMVVGDLTPGTHSVRMQLPGYHPWVTAVTLGPGARERVAASLEQ
jgi:eukaryotic-like serine/threonine-protein kinase